MILANYYTKKRDSYLYATDIATQKIIDVKQHYGDGEYFFDLLDERYSSNSLMEFDYITIPPSSDANKRSWGLEDVAETFSIKLNSKFSLLLSRHTSVSSARFGGSRDIWTHYDSISVVRNVKNKSILLIDDVHVSGSTVDACEWLLREAGATNVTKLCLGKSYCGVSHV